MLMRKTIRLLDINEIYCTKTFYEDKMLGNNRKFVEDLVPRLVFGQEYNHFTSLNFIVHDKGVIQFL